MRELAKSENHKFHIFSLLRENFSNISAKEKVYYNFPYKEVNFSKLKYFLIIITKRFFLLYNIFSILNKLLFFILGEIFVMFTTIF